MFLGEKKEKKTSVFLEKFSKKVVVRIAFVKSKKMNEFKGSGKAVNLTVKSRVFQESCSVGWLCRQELD